MNGSDSDSEQKKWGQKRQQLDAAVSTARFNGAIEGLIQGTTDVRSLIGILDELNNMQSQRGRYMTEILALKVESRRLLTAPFNERVAEFLIEGARRIPWLSDGLASQFAVALGSAADNPSYLETVNTAVGNLLLDVTRPLKPDTRNYLRALTDKIVASRRLQEARGHLAIVPSVYPSAIPQHLADAGSLELAPTIIAQPPQRALSTGEPGARVGTAPTTLKMGAAEDVAVAPPLDPARSEFEVDRTSVAEGKLERAAVYPPIPGRDAGGVDVTQASKNDAASARDTRPELPSISAGKTTPGLGSSAAKKTTGDRRSSSRHQVATDIASGGFDPAEPARFAAVPAVKSVSTGTSEGDDDWADLDQNELQAEQVRQGRRRGIPIWILVVAAGAVVAAGVAAWLLTRGPEPSSLTAASTSATAAVSTPRPAQAKGKLTAAASVKAPAASSPAPPPPSAAVTPTPPPSPPPAAVSPAPAIPKTAPPPSLPRTPSPPAVKPSLAPRTTPAPMTATPPPSRPTVPAIAPKPPPAVAPAQPQPAKPPSEKAAPKMSAEPPSEPAPVVPRTPTVSRTIDDIIVELLQVPNDVASIEAKAHEVARIVARSSRNDAEIILRRLIPEEVLAGTETVDTRALEPVRRVVALLLKKVALDKDDQRAALAIETLGEWAKLRKHGAAAKMTLDELAEERVVLSRPKRLHALERVQARLGISNAGE